MAKVTLETPKNADHVGIVGDNLLCEHCGTRQKMALPMDMELAAGFMKLFTKRHRHCPKREGVSAFRFATSMQDWLASDDTGLSSKTIYRHMIGLVPFDVNYPHDPSDFGRCYRLLALAPEWRGRMGEMAAYGPIWARLAAAWDELTALYEEEVDVSTLPHKAKRDGSAPRLYERMKDIATGRFRDPNQTDIVSVLSDLRNASEQP